MTKCCYGQCRWNEDCYRKEQQQSQETKELRKRIARRIARKKKETR